MMKRIILLLSLISLIFISNIEGAVPTRQYANTSGQVIDPDKVTSNEDVIYLYLQAGVEAYKDGSITADDLISNIAITSSGNMTFSGTTNISGTLQLGGTAITSSAAELNKTDGLNATTAELNILNGATLSTTELNYVDGVTSAIQTQLDGKSATTGNASIVTVGTITTGGWAATAVPVAYGGTGATSAANARTNLGLGSVENTALSTWAGSTNITTVASTIMKFSDTRFKVGIFSIDTTTASGNQAVTGVGFTPTAIIFFAGQNSTTERSWGFSTGSTANYCVVNSNSTGVVQDSWSIFDEETATTTLYEGKILTFDADGFTISWTKVGSPSGTLYVEYLAMR